MKWSLDACREGLPAGPIRLRPGQPFMLVELPEGAGPDLRLRGPRFVYVIDVCPKCKGWAARFLAMPEGTGMRCRRCQHVWEPGNEEGQVA
jgi:hypothetical protein